jgi:very-short-patch-repair endonuclease
MDIKDFAKKLNKQYPKSEDWFVYQLHLKGTTPEELGLQTNKPLFNKYIADFFFPGIIIEIDDSSHNFKKIADEKRDKFFRKKGIKTIRIPFLDVEAFEKAYKEIKEYIYINKMKYNIKGCKRTRKLLK